MTDDFSIYFEPPEHGWLTISLSCGGEVLHADVSHIYPDSLPKLIAAAASALNETGRFQASFLLEPGELVIVIEANAGRCSLRVSVPVHPDRGTENFFVNDIPSSRLALCLWRALRDVWGRTGQDHWNLHWPPGFPESSVESLGRQIKIA